LKKVLIEICQLLNSIDARLKILQEKVDRCIELEEETIDLINTPSYYDIAVGAESTLGWWNDKKIK